jgi:hypothetical protein
MWEGEGIEKPRVALYLTSDGIKTGNVKTNKNCNGKTIS